MDFSSSIRLPTGATHSLFILIVDGNIGAGKSSFLETLKNDKRFKDTTKIVLEPLYMWEDLLKSYYKEQAESMISMQHYIMQCHFCSFMDELKCFIFGNTALQTTTHRTNADVHHCSPSSFSSSALQTETKKLLLLDSSSKKSNPCRFLILERDFLSSLFFNSAISLSSLQSSIIHSLSDLFFHQFLSLVQSMLFPSSTSSSSDSQQLSNDNDQSSDSQEVLLSPYYLHFVRLYMRTPASHCMSHVRIRNRKGEESISMEYLQQLQLIHDSFYSHAKAKRLFLFNAPLDTACCFSCERYANDHSSLFNDSSYYDTTSSLSLNETPVPFSSVLVEEELAKHHLCDHHLFSSSDTVLMKHSSSTFQFSDTAFSKFFSSPSSHSFVLDNHPFLFSIPTFVDHFAHFLSYLLNHFQ